MPALLPNSALCEDRAMDYLQTEPNSFPPFLPLFLPPFLSSYCSENISEYSIKHKWLIKATYFYTIKHHNTSFSVENIHNYLSESQNPGSRQER